MIGALMLAYLFLSCSTDTKDKRVLPPASKDGHDGITSAEMEGSFAWPDEVPGFIQIILNDKLLQAQSVPCYFRNET